MVYCSRVVNCAFQGVPWGKIWSKRNTVEGWQDILVKIRPFPFLENIIFSLNCHKMWRSLCKVVKYIKLPKDLVIILEPINHHKYWVITPLCPWQSKKKIHTYVLPRLWWNMQWLIESSIVTKSFGCLIYLTTLHKLLHILWYLRPKVMFYKNGNGLISTKVSYHPSIVFLFDQVFPHGTPWNA